MSLFFHTKYSWNLFCRPPKGLENEIKLGLSIHGIISTAEPTISFHINSKFHKKSAAITTRFLYLSQYAEINGGLPKWILISTDNFVADNKSKLNFHFWILLISLGIIDGVALLFMPKGHTHGSVDALFGNVSQKMLEENEITSWKEFEKVCFVIFFDFVF